eukprot:5371025-Amphidinium_carterae.1
MQSQVLWGVRTNPIVAMTQTLRGSRTSSTVKSHCAFPQNATKLPQEVGKGKKASRKLQPSVLLQCFSTPLPLDATTFLLVFGVFCFFTMAQGCDYGGLHGVYRSSS